jgi:hypothetical protein
MEHDIKKNATKILAGLKEKKFDQLTIIQQLKSILL